MDTDCGIRVRLDLRKLSLCWLAVDARGVNGIFKIYTSCFDM